MSLQCNNERTESSVIFQCTVPLSQHLKSDLLTVTMERIFFYLALFSPKQMFYSILSAQLIPHNHRYLSERDQHVCEKGNSSLCVKIRPHTHGLTIDRMASIKGM